MRRMPPPAKLWLTLVTLIAVLSFSSASRALDASEHSIAATNLGDQIYMQAESIFQKATDVHYEHAREDAGDQVVFSADGHECTSRNDCSGFVSYLLSHFAAKQYAEIHQLQAQKDYPQAKTFAQFFDSLKSGETDQGFEKISSVSELRRGDLIAWAKPVEPGKKKGNTGHVLVVADRASETTASDVDGEKFDYVSVPVIDSSSVDHFGPEELPPHAGQKHRDGVGKGVVRILVDAQGHPIGYWEGTFWNEGGKEIHHPTRTPLIACARLIGTSGQLKH